ncbi:MAG TPA: hypothetical protein VF063_00730 [Gaiellaceae bacterium]
MEAVSLVGRTLPPRFRRVKTAVAPGATRPYDEAEWRDALVVVERGEIELECVAGTCGTFRRGAILWLTGLPVRALHNRGRDPAVLVAIFRRGTDEFQVAASSDGRDD